jgi:hypothetical protein
MTAAPINMGIDSRPLQAIITKAVRFWRASDATAERKSAHVLMRAMRFTLPIAHAGRACA